MHIRKSSSNPAAVYAALDANVTAALWTMQPNYAHITEVVITPLDGLGTSLPVVTGSPAKWSGSGGSGDMIPQVANIVKLVSARRGRSYRGRVYLPFALEGQVSNGNFGGSALTALNTAWVAFRTAMSSAGFPLVVASYVHATAEDVIAVLAEAPSATQRRRMRR